MNCKMINPRGIRNNNPANIRRGSSWLGLSSEQTDKSFCQFTEMKYGIRALIVLLRTYHYKYKINTLANVLHRFAPLSENNTYAYIAFVRHYMYEHQPVVYINGALSHKVRFEDDFPINIWYNKTAPSPWFILFVLAVLKMESGKDFSPEDIEEALNLL